MLSRFVTRSGAVVALLALCTCVLVVGHGFADDETVPPDTCIVEVNVPAGASVKIDGRDYGQQRVFRFGGLERGRIYRSALTVSFESGARDERTVLVQSGRRLRIPLLDPVSTRPELVLQTGSAFGGVTWCESRPHVLCGNLLSDAQSGHYLRRFEKPQTPSFVDFSPSGDRVALATWNQPPGSLENETVYLYATDTGRLIWSQRIEHSYTRAVAFSPTGERLAIALGRHQPSPDKSPGSWPTWYEIHIRDVASARLLHTLRPSRAVGTLIYTRDGKHLISGDATTLSFQETQQGQSNYITVWDAGSGRRLRRIDGFSGSIRNISAGTNGRLAAYDYGGISIVDINTGKRFAAPTKHIGAVEDVFSTEREHEVLSVTFSHAGRSEFRIAAWNIRARKHLYSRQVAVPELHAVQNRDVAVGYAPVAHQLFFRASRYDSQEMTHDGVMFCVDVETSRRLWTVKMSGRPEFAVSPSGNVAIAKVGPERFRLVRGETGETVNEFSADWLGPAQFTSDGKRLVVFDRSSAALLVDVPSMKPVKTFTAESSIYSIALSRDGKYLAGGTSGFRERSARVYIWNLKTGEQVALVEPFAKSQRMSVKNLCFSRDCRQLVALSYYSVAAVLDVPSGKRICEITSAERTEKPSSAIFASDGQLVTGVNGALLVWNTRKATPTHKLRTHAKFLSGAQFTPDGRHLITFGSNGVAQHSAEPKTSEVVIFDTETLQEERRFQGIPGHCRGGDICPDAKQLLMQMTGGAVLIDLESGRIGHRFGRTDRMCANVRCDEQGTIIHKRIAADSRIADIVTGQRFASPRIQDDVPIDVLNVRSDRRWMIVRRNIHAPSLLGRKVEQDRKAQVWSLYDGRLVFELTGHAGSVSAAQFNSDGSRIATLSMNFVRLWDGRSGRALHQIQLSKDWNIFGGPMARIQFSPDGKKLLTTYNQPRRNAQGVFFRSGDAVIWDVRTGKKLITLTQQVRQTAADFSPDGRFIVTAAVDDTSHATLWDAHKGRVLRRLSDDQAGNDCVVATFSPDGRLVVTQRHRNRDILVWEAATGRLLRRVTDLPNSTGLAFSPDGRLLIGNSFWLDVFTGQNVASVVLGGDEALIVSLEGLFDGAPSARSKVTYRVGRGLRVVPVDRFFQDFYRPGLLGEIWRGGRPLPTVEFAEQVAPRVSIVAPTSGEVKSRDVTVEVTAEDEGGGIADLALYHNGARVGSIKDIARERNKIVQRSFLIRLVEGENRLQATAASADGSWESEPAQITLTYRGQVAKSQLHLLAVGVSDYADSSLNLRYSARDAERFAELFRRRGHRLYERVHAQALVDEQATRDGITKNLQRMVKTTQPQDTLVVLFSGHGAMVGQRYYFVPHELSREDDRLEDDIRKQCLPADAISDLLGQAAALKRVLVFDTCHGGGALQIAERTRTGFALRGAIDRLSRRQGVFTIAASADSEKAHESDKLAHGLLSYTLLAALDAVDQGPLDDVAATTRDEEQVVSVATWFDFADAHVTKLTEELFGYRQTVQMSTRGSSFPVLPLAD